MPPTCHWADAREILKRAPGTALRRVFGGSRWITFCKLTGLLTIYFAVFMVTVVMLVLVTLWWF